MAAMILKHAYARRVKSVADAQMAGEAPKNLFMVFHEPEQFAYVVSALEAARQIGIRDCCKITYRAVDATYGDKKVNKALQAVDRDVQALRTDSFAVSVAK
jgi:hypothetical protein